MKKRTIINLVLAAFVIGMFAVCIWSPVSEISFEDDVKARETAVQSRLKQVRDAEDAFRRVHKRFCGDIDSLIAFVKNEKSFKETNQSRELTDDEYESLAKEIEASGEFTDDEIKRLIPEKAIEKGIIQMDTIWESVAEMIGISNPDSLKYLPVGRPGATIALRMKEILDRVTNEASTLVEFRANIEDYLDGLGEKKIENYRKELVNRGGYERAGLWADVDSVDHDKDMWVGLCMGDLNDETNKLSGNWHND